MSALTGRFIAQIAGLLSVLALLGMKEMGP